jgi:hypothetical protein
LNRARKREENNVCSNNVRRVVKIKVEDEVDIEIGDAEKMLLNWLNRLLVDILNGNNVDNNMANSSSALEYSSGARMVRRKKYKRKFN